MSDVSIKTRLKQIQEKTRERLRTGRDPKISQWQGALEALLVKINEHLVPGEVITFDSLSPEEIKQFQRLQVVMDLSPFVTAVFLPRQISQKLVKSKMGAYAAGLNKDSDKILVTPVDNHDRIMMAELSPQKSGIEIFDDGSQLGIYSYNTQEECLTDMSKIVWLHLKPKAWTQADYIKYTEGWFFRSASNKLIDLPINQNHSYIHHPVLLHLNAVQAIFKLIRATLLRICGNLDNTIALANAENLHKSGTPEISRDALLADDGKQKQLLKTYIENRMLELLKLLRSYEAVNFKGFSAAEQREFKNAFARTVEEVYRELLQEG